MWNLALHEEAGCLVYVNGLKEKGLSASGGPAFGGQVSGTRTLDTGPVFAVATLPATGAVLQRCVVGQFRELQLLGRAVAAALGAACGICRSRAARGAATTGAVLQRSVVGQFRELQFLGRDVSGRTACGMWHLPESCRSWSGYYRSGITTQRCRAVP